MHYSVLLWCLIDDESTKGLLRLNPVELSFAKRIAMSINRLAMVIFHLENLLDYVKEERLG
jgi:hypothetical protein